MQGELEKALATIFRRSEQPPTLTVAGRTDAGVHAIGQVAHLDLSAEQVRILGRGLRTADSESSAASLARRLNGIAGLKADVHVLRSVVAPPGFDARFSATWRRYRYRVADAAALRNPLERNFTLWYPRLLDAEGMHEAAVGLLGLHDWASYCRPREGATTIRTLQEFSWRRLEDGVLVAEVRADAFCHNMVRALVGATIAVGEGKLSAAELIAIRQERRRTNDFRVVPSAGLVLVAIGYPDDAELGSRAEQTRARRAPLD